MQNVREVHEFYSDLEKKNKDLEAALEEMRRVNREKKDILNKLTEELTEVKNDNNQELDNEKNNVLQNMDSVNKDLNKIEGEIAHLEDPIDKILTCVGRMYNQLKSDGKTTELSIHKLRNVLNEVSLKATSL